MLGILAACVAVQIVIRARQEEAHGTAEPVLVGGRAVACAGSSTTWSSRSSRWSSWWGMACSARMLGLASVDGGSELMETIVVTAFGQLVAASVFLVLTALVFVLAPRATIAVGWTLIAVGAIFGMFGPLFGFPDWIASLSPLEAAPKVTMERRRTQRTLVAHRGRRGRRGGGDHPHAPA